MGTYVMLTTVGPDGWARIQEQPERIREVTAEVEAMGLKVVAQYALLGQWDFLNVIEAPDEATISPGRGGAGRPGHDAHDDAPGDRRGRPDRVAAGTATSSDPRRSDPAVSDPPHGAALPLRPDLVGPEVGGEDRVVDCGGGPVAAAFVGREHGVDREARRPAAVEAGAHLDAGPWSTAPLKISCPPTPRWSASCRVRRSRHGCGCANVRSPARDPDADPPAGAAAAGGRDQVVCGIDEVGRGAWAGPVTVAAVVPAARAPPGVRDSKQLTRAEREQAAGAVRRGPSPSGVGHASHEECDELGHDRGAAHGGDARARRAGRAGLRARPHRPRRQPRLPGLGIARHHRDQGRRQVPGGGGGVVRGQGDARRHDARGGRALTRRTTSSRTSATRRPRTRPRWRGYGPSAIHRRSWIFMESLCWRGVAPAPGRLFV